MEKDPECPNRVAAPSGSTSIQTALPGPNHPGSPSGLAKSRPRKYPADLVVVKLGDALLEKRVWQMHATTLRFWIRA
jgi:hypothetical protein